MHVPHFDQIFNILVQTEIDLVQGCQKRPANEHVESELDIDQTNPLFTRSDKF